MGRNVGLELRWYAEAERRDTGPHNVNNSVNDLLAISILDFDISGEPGPQAKEVNHIHKTLLLCYDSTNDMLRSRCHTPLPYSLNLFTMAAAWRPIRHM